MLRVTDKKFWIHPTLKSNIDSLIINAKNDFDFMIIISGSGTVRGGKSVMGMQLAYYIEYQRAKMNKRKIDFTIENNICFSGAELIENAKKKRESIFVYDEAREGLDNKKMWEKKTQDLLDFFAECGMYNHFLIVVLPDYFELPKGIAITRSILLLNVYYVKKHRKLKKGFGDIKTGQEYLDFVRGRFDYYNRKAKKNLYNFGRKTQDYTKAKPIFSGEFLNYWVIDKKVYEAKKLKFLNRQRTAEESQVNRFLMQRNILFKILSDFGFEQKEIASLCTDYGFKMTGSGICRAIGAYTKELRIEN